MYKDQILKLQSYKQELISSFIKKGVYPNKLIIENKLKEFDTKVSIFKAYVVESGSNLNVTKFNLAMKALYTDLMFLYKILEEILLNDLHELQVYNAAHLKDVQDITEMYQRKILQESSFDYLGQTVLFKYKNFEQKLDNEITTIDLGNVDLQQGSNVSCVVDIDNIESINNILLTVKDKDSIEATYPFINNRAAFKVPGTVELRSTEYNIPPNQVVNGPILLDIKRTEDDYKYYIFNGKNHLLVQDQENRENELFKRPTRQNKFVADKDSVISFYVLNGTSISFDFKTPPKTANFDITKSIITNLNRIHYFFMEVEEGFEFGFEMENGIMYAAHEVVKNNNKPLYFNNYCGAHDFFIESQIIDKKYSYQLGLKIYNSIDGIIDINNVIVKENLNI